MAKIYIIFTLSECRTTSKNNISLDFIICLHYNNPPLYLRFFGIKPARDDQIIIINIEVIFLHVFLIKQPKINRV